MEDERLRTESEMMKTSGSGGFKKSRDGSKDSSSRRGKGSKKNTSRSVRKDNETRLSTEEDDIKMPPQPPRTRASGKLKLDTVKEDSPVKTE